MTTYFDEERTLKMPLSDDLGTPNFKISGFLILQCVQYGKFFRIGPASTPKIEQELRNLPCVGKLTAGHSPAKRRCS